MPDQPHPSPYMLHGAYYLNVRSTPPFSVHASWCLLLETHTYQRERLVCCHTYQRDRLVRCHTYQRERLVRCHTYQRDRLVRCHTYQRERLVCCHTYQRERLVRCHTYQRERLVCCHTYQRERLVMCRGERPRRWTANSAPGWLLRMPGKGARDTRSTHLTPHKT